LLLRNPSEHHTIKTINRVDAEDILNNSEIDLSWSWVEIEKGIKAAALSIPEQKKCKDLCPKVKSVDKILFLHPNSSQIHEQKFTPHFRLVPADAMRSTCYLPYTESSCRKTGAGCILHGYT